jgi:hypothetical protein
MVCHPGKITVFLKNTKMDYDESWGKLYVVPLLKKTVYLSFNLSLVR